MLTDVRRFAVAAVLMLAFSVAACGGSDEGAGGAPADPEDGGRTTEEITALLRDYYEHPAGAQCGAWTTERYRSAVYGGDGPGALAACREHQEARAEMAEVQRTIFVDDVRVEGDTAVAQVQAGGITVTDSLVKKTGKWLLDDESSPFTRRGAGPPVGGGEEQAGGPKAFGQPATFNSIPGIPPRTSVAVSAGAPIDPGVDRERNDAAVFRFGDDFGQPGKPQQVRFINLPVKLTNLGSKPFRGQVGGFAYDASGHEFAPLDRRDITQRSGALGRLPDWTAGEGKGIAPRARTTRYLTFAVPVHKRIVKWVLEPVVLSRPNTVTGLEPLDGVVYRPARRKD